MTESGKLAASDGAPGYEFGRATGLSGDVAVVGAVGGNDDDGVHTGSAYVFERSGGSWSETAKLTPGDGPVDNAFGASVAVSGDVAVVGAPRDDEKGTLSGSAYVFEGSGGTWSEVAKLTASDGAAEALFGTSVVVSGDVVVVGAWGDGDHGSFSGSAYVFERSGGTWSEVAKLTASDGAANDAFGASVAVSGDVVVVGAGQDDDRGSNSGSAYVFEGSGGSWSEVAKLTASDGAAGDDFGASVAVSGGVVVVGARFDEDVGPQTGSAYVFEGSDGSWSEVAKLTASDGEAWQRLGGKVAVSGDLVVVGATGDETHGRQSGAAYVFEGSGGSWSEVAKLTASDGAAGDDFGASLAVSGDGVVVGAPDDDDGGAASGSAYVFDVASP